MRITNEMMNQTSLVNINRNKTYLDQLNTQMASGKKITRPSDDPVVAIRALRLRNSLSEITQYYENSVPDAKDWVSATVEAITGTSKIVSGMRAQFVEGSNGPETTESRAAILKELQGLRDQIYDNGNADYAGRSLFTGYRTGVKLTFDTDTTLAYQDIKEGFSASDISDTTYISGKITTTDVANVTSGVEESDVVSDTIPRIRLAYDELDVNQHTTPMKLTYRTASTATSAQTADGFDVTFAAAPGSPVSISITTGPDGKNIYSASPSTASVTEKDGVLTIKDGSGNVANTTGSGRVQNAYIESTIDVAVVSVTDTSTDPYLNAKNNGKTTLIPETGEIVLSDADAAILRALPDITGVDTIEIQYDKKDWAEDDLRPEHYFDCKDVDNSITYASHDQEICYDVTANQSMRVNTFASELYTHDIGRDVDEAITTLEEVDAAQAKVTALEKLQSDTSVNQDDVTDLLAAANKELTLAKDKSQKFFESRLTTFQGYIDRTNLAATNAGTRTNRLELISNRLGELKTNASELQKNNENVEINNIAIEVSSAELAYNAALLATGKISQQTLLNYL